MPMRPWWRAIGAALALLGAAVPIATLAHAGLASSTPAAGATLSAPPESVTLIFDDELLPDGTGFSVTDPSGASVGEGELDLAVAERNEIAGPVAIADAGVYTVAWTSVAADGHEEAGEFTFTVGSEPEASDSPDTAMPTHSSEVPTLGALFLLAAVAVALRRARGAVR
jgi:methionine-rich copper-binding protein CopC